MPKTEYKGLKPFAFHGVEYSHSDGDEQANGDCPFCSKEGKFFINADTTQWDCKSCGLSGNATTFIRKLWEASTLLGPEAAELIKKRKLLNIETIDRWGVRISSITGGWLVPGFGTDGKLNQLYKYDLDRASGKYLLYATPDLHHQVHGALTSLLPNQPTDETIANKDTVYICEGPWDGMALWEVMDNTKYDDQGKIVLTSNKSISLLANAAVIAVPGANVFTPGWAELLGGKKVVLMYDSDHTRENKQTKATIPSVGLEGMKRVAGILASYEDPPAEIHYLEWGPNGFDPKLPSGYDVRDWLNSDKNSAKMSVRAGLLQGLLAKVRPVPDEWIAGKGSSSKKGTTGMALTPCNSWKELVQSWRKSMKWTERLDRALSVMLSVVTSTQAVGDQLWCKIIGPPSCGKSTLCEAISVAREHIIAKSTIRGFHSGYKTDKDGDEDHSLIAKIGGKTLITKDGDTLLQSPNLKQILSEARDIYDTTSRTDYRHGLSRDYEGIRMTWILCGTASLRQIDESELGARFIDCVIMEGINDELEDEILWRVVNRAERGMGLQSNGDLDTQQDPDMVKTMQLTGGYIDYLRKNSQRLLAAVEMPDIMKRKIVYLGKFVAYMRARPSKTQNESAGREFGSRLVSQFVRLAKCLAVVLNRNTVDDEVMNRVRHCALDTARGRTLELIKHLYKRGQEGATTKTLAILTNETEKEERTLLSFLRKIDAIELHTQVKAGVSMAPKWRLNAKMTKLYDEVMNYTNIARGS